MLVPHPPPKEGRGGITGRCSQLKPRFACTHSLAHTRTYLFTWAHILLLKLQLEVLHVFLGQPSSNGAVAQISLSNHFPSVMSGTISSPMTQKPVQTCWDSCRGRTHSATYNYRLVHKAPAFQYPSHVSKTFAPFYRRNIDNSLPQAAAAASVVRSVGVGGAPMTDEA